MPEVNFQTVKLAAGKHKSPDSGACVMELASMLAGEKFSDHPQCVSPVIAAFLRHYNDSLGKVQRQELRPLAVKVLNSRGTPEVEAARLRHLREWTAETRPKQYGRLSDTWKIAPIVKAGLKASRPGTLEHSAWEAVHAAKPHNQASHRAVTQLVSDLLEIGKPSRQPQTRIAQPSSIQA